MMLCNIMECHCNVQYLLLYYISEVGNEERPPQLTFKTQASDRFQLETLCTLYYLDTILQMGKLLNKFTVVSEAEIGHTCMNTTSMQ